MLFKKYWQAIFAIVLIADVIALLVHLKEAHVVLKPLLMPILMVGLIQHKKDKAERNWRLIFGALLLSWAGDVLLLLSSDKIDFFVFGLICFLVAHIAYILYFSRYKKGRGDWYKKQPLVALLVIIYSLFLYAFLLPFLGSLMIPVAFYTLVISIMLLQALGSQPFLPPNSRILFVLGASFFVLSDSLLAINKFYMPLHVLNGLVMATYGLAQAFFVAGAIRNADRTVPVV